jgi:hypothetical protein
MEFNSQKNPGKASAPKNIGTGNPESMLLVLRKYKN